ncbi:MAG: alpha-E domain-containing protein [Lachnospiraceae bacterium]
MGIITVEKVDHLLWLGRYIERVHTTLKEFFVDYDNMIDVSDDAYKDYCRRINVPDVYGSKEVFLQKYLFDDTDINSVASNLNRAYDNAIVIRDDIGSETLSYIQLAVYDIEKAKSAPSTIVELQGIIDHILAFWGCVDDMVDEECIRSIMKAGRRIERLDLYLRFNMPAPVLKRELKKLNRRIVRTGITYNTESLENLPYLLNQPEIDYEAALEMVESIV